mgnify:CR=1 FL=1
MTFGLTEEREYVKGSTIQENTEKNRSVRGKKNGYMQLTQSRLGKVEPHYKTIIAQS